MGLRIVLVAVSVLVLTAVALAEQPVSPIVFPRENSIVGSRLNLVVDPTEVPFFQVIVGKTEYPVVDTSTGKHAYQGLELQPGLNTITVKVFAPPPPPEEKEAGKEADKDAKEKDQTRNAGNEKNKVTLKLTSTWERKVFSRVELLTGKAIPAGFKREPFHSREHETSCSGCHNLDAPSKDSAPPKKPEDVICYACHRKIPSGKHVHGPVAAWNCLACHDPDAYPVKYQFNAIDPWKVTKTVQAVEPMLYTISSSGLFNPESAVLVVSPDKARDLFKEMLDYIKQNPGDGIRLEVHADNTPVKQSKVNVKGKVSLVGFRTNQALTDARAKALASLLKEFGIKSITAVGMGDKLPKASNATPEGRELNNRIEIVAHPAGITIKNSQALPILKDRERVLISLTYSQGPQINKLSISENLPTGLQYVNGSSYFNGKAREPKTNGNELVWELGEMEPNFSQSLFFVVKKGKDTLPVPPAVKVVYSIGASEMTREFDPKVPSKRGLTIREVCLKCHKAVLEAKFKHGPADAGYCTLCHNPHASKYDAMLRKSSWSLCVTCHSDKGAGAHVLAYSGKGTTHPTRLRRDPMRPGKRISCASCHDPHSADSNNLFTYEARTRTDMCKLCHAKI